ncbi:aldo/keto reductase [Amycolatopsis decaplanina]|uniref:Aldo/keto reductase n=1 Tax=Amycolatopsis decaplanina DSM 44594 TaxID=1284240 RepID=M2X1Q7_9PSEU|nr:aldo/keto reductase [Amycolatopsis decaplanina]EME54956.1 aldo/keto reductase [Amycolatopsis decaplanina DSM 44594]
MERLELGATDLVVSRLGLGTMTWGGVTDEEAAAEQLKAFIEAGGNFLDTADVYAGGRAEETIGKLLGGVVAREDIVLASKAVGVLDGEPRPRSDASKRHLLEALDASLRRLGTDHLDLWQMHAWDSTVPLEETMEAIDVAVSSGRVRHAGICNYSGWQTMKATGIQKAQGRPPLASTQVEYSLLERGIEREVVPAVQDQNLGILCWASLGRGVLTGKYRNGVPERRLKSKPFQAYVGQRLDEHSTRIVAAVAEAADTLGVGMVDIALSWLWRQPWVTVALVGARNSAQLQDSLAAATKNFTLPEDTLSSLSLVSRPQRGYPENGV